MGVHVRSLNVSALVTILVGCSAVAPERGSAFTQKFVKLPFPQNVGEPGRIENCQYSTISTVGVRYFENSCLR